jgi:hypothetical protein
MVYTSFEKRAIRILYYIDRPKEQFKILEKKKPKRNNRIRKKPNKYDPYIQEIIHRINSNKKSGTLFLS